MPGTSFEGSDTSSNAAAHQLSQAAQKPDQTYRCRTVLIFGQCAWTYSGVGCQEPRLRGPILQATRRHISYLRHYGNQTIPTVAGCLSSLVSVLGSALAWVLPVGGCFGLCASLCIVVKGAGD
jgi:hypothetical protein